MQSGYGLPLYIGGIPNPVTGQTLYAITIPQGESLLSHFALNTFTEGLDAFPPSARPEPIRVHLAFDGMVGCAFFILLVAVLFWLLFFRRKRRVPEYAWLLWGVLIAGVMGGVLTTAGAKGELRIDIQENQRRDGILNEFSASLKSERTCRSIGV